MIATAFPDLQWLKQQIAARFRDRRGLSNLALDADGFPSVVINATTKESYRPDIVGPVSLFLNLKGQSRCKVDGRTVLVDADHYFISNRFQSYTLEIEQDEPVETFNIHIGEYFSEQFFASALNTSDTLLNEGAQLTVPTVAFHNKLFTKDARFSTLVSRLQLCKRSRGIDRLLFEETLAALLQHLLEQHRNILKDIEALSPLKRSTRLELYKRVSQATDLIHSRYTGQPELDEMAAAACLSKFHFLRLFKEVHHCSPYQYLQQLRMQRSEQLLRSGTSVADIALQLGFENGSSFSRLFRQHKGVYPSQYKAQVN